MSPLLFLAISFAGGIGASTRFVVDSAIRSRLTSPTPWGTILINISGSFLLGIFTGLALGAVVSDAVLWIIGTGFLGGYTTFSTSAVETVRAIQGRHSAATAWSTAGTLVGSVMAAGVGLLVGADV